MDDPIRPIDALQLLLAASNPGLAGKVTLEWFRQKQCDPVDPSGALGSDVAAPLDDETKVVHAAVTSLNELIRKSKIRPWGRRDGEGDRIPIEDDHQPEGAELAPHCVARLSGVFVSIFAYLIWFYLLNVSGATAASSYHFMMPPLENDQRETGCRGRRRALFATL